MVCRSVTLLYTIRTCDVAEGRQCVWTDDTAVYHLSKAVLRCVCVCVCAWDVLLWLMCAYACVCAYVLVDVVSWCVQEGVYGLT